MTQRDDGTLSRDIQCAASSDANVLISGSDQRVRLAMARRIHGGSARRAELLVHVRSGEPLHVVLERFERVGPTGTLFIEEASALSAVAQAELMRVLDRRSTRVIAATADTLLDRIASQSFDPNLFYRLNTLHLVLPGDYDSCEPHFPPPS